MSHFPPKTPLDAPSDALLDTPPPKLPIRQWYWQANPKQFLRWMTPCLWPALFLGLLFYAMGTLWGFFFSSLDYLHGTNVRFLYIHVPAAWMCMGLYGVMVVCAIFSFVHKHPLCDLMAQATAPIGFCFTTLCLFTGALWGHVAWGTAWIWDARLTSVFILWLLYGSHIILFQAFPDWTKGARISAFLALFGAVNLPIIKWSVEWWNTLHQPASFFRLGRPAVHGVFLGPLLIFALSFLFLSLSLVGMGVRRLFYERKLSLFKLNLR